MSKATEQVVADMEKRIQQKIDLYFSAYQENMRKLIETSGWKQSPDVCALFQHMCDYPPLTLDEDDYRPQLKYKQPVTEEERCVAKRPSGTQCTRRKKKGCNYCGTHLKTNEHGQNVADGQNKNGQTNANGQTEQNIESVPSICKTTLSIQEYQGIYYHMDKDGNVYCAEDVMNNYPYPRVIGNYSQGNMTWC